MKIDEAIKRIKVLRQRAQKEPVTETAWNQHAMSIRYLLLEFESALESWRQAMAFYANSAHYATDLETGMSTIAYDHGQRARELLGDAQ